MLGVPQHAVTGWESGVGFRHDDLLLLAEATDTSVDWLIEGLTDRDIEEGMAFAATVAPFEASRLFPRADDRIQVRRVLTDEELQRSISSALKLTPESLTASIDSAAGSSESACLRQPFSSTCPARRSCLERGRGRIASTRATGRRREDGFC